MTEKLNFEKSLQRLEEITTQLEDGELSLDDSLKLYEEGIKLSRFCEKKLTSVEQKIEVLTSSDLDQLDSFARDPFQEKAPTQSVNEQPPVNNEQPGENPDDDLSIESLDESFEPPVASMGQSSDNKGKKSKKVKKTPDPQGNEEENFLF